MMEQPFAIDKIIFDLGVDAIIDKIVDGILCDPILTNLETGSEILRMTIGEQEAEAPDDTELRSIIADLIDGSQGRRTSEYTYAPLKSLFSLTPRIGRENV